MAGFALEPYLACQRARVEGVLRERADRILASAPPKLAEAVRYSLLDGGKRLRPILCLAWGEAVGHASGGGEALEDAASAVEMVHTYSLIHDDLPAMDDDELRRGRPTSHKAFGEAMAILAGDALLTGAFGLLGSGAEACRSELVRILAEGAGGSGMIAGQVLDIAEDRPAEAEYLVRLHRLKTGALIRAACAMGAVASGSSRAEREAAETYGAAVGLAFQIADDLLDVTATAAELGKNVGRDAAAGRPTFPAVLGLDRARALAAEQVALAREAARVLEREPGPLAALAGYAVERRS